jgi:hypothetical protein
MALSASTLKTALKAALISTAGAQDNATTEALAEAIATAVVDHITANASVLPTALIAPAGGGPVTGTGTVS